jgi:hypothetical protein
MHKVGAESSDAVADISDIRRAWPSSGRCDRDLDREILGDFESLGSSVQRNQLVTDPLINGRGGQILDQ